MTTMKGMHYIVSGKVQGVFYRAATCKKAKELVLSGWVRNLPDGSVEVEVFGAADQLAIFEEWLWEGSSASRVVEVENQPIPWQEFNDFLVR